MSTVKAINLQHPTSTNVNVTLASSGNIGVGNTNPNVKMVVDGPATGGAPIVQINATSIDSGTFQWLTYAQAPLANGQNYVHIFGKALSQYNCGYIGYKHAGDNLSTNSVTLGMYAADNLLNVYGNGCVTKPNQPMFSVRKSDGGATYTGVFIGNVVDVNVGSYYNTSNGRFTAPVAGTYSFSVFALFSSGGTDTGQSFVFYKNGAATGVIPYTRSTGAQYTQCGGTCMFTLAAGDYVQVLTDGGTWYATGAMHNCFSGHLVG
jgi:hypothetical protein